MLFWVIITMHELQNLPVTLPFTVFWEQPCLAEWRLFCYPFPRPPWSTYCSGSLEWLTHLHLHSWNLSELVDVEVKGSCLLCLGQITAFLGRTWVDEGNAPALLQSMPTGWAPNSQPVIPGLEKPAWVYDGSSRVPQGDRR